MFCYGSASAQKVPEQQLQDRQAKTLARALAYDEKLLDRAGSAAVLAIVYKAGNPESEKEANDWFGIFSNLESYSIRGLPFHIIMLPFSTTEATEKSVADSKVVALYVCRGLEGDTPAIKQISQRRKATTVASREEQMTAGLAIGVFSDHGKLVVVVNLPVSRAEGAQFGTDLLRLARVIQ